MFVFSRPITKLPIIIPSPSLYRRQNQQHTQKPEGYIFAIQKFHYILGPRCRAVPFPPPL
jgi:hypothetical protein